MNKGKIFSLLLSMSCVFAYADSAIISSDYASTQNLYVGPEVFWKYSNPTALYNDTALHLHENTVYGGIRLNYEMFKPEALYLGTDAIIAIGRDVHKSGKDSLSEVVFGDGSGKRHTRIHGNIEQRIGYTYQSGLYPMSTVSPFVGLGWHYAKADRHHGIHSDWLYAAAGIRTKHEYTKNFDIGFLAKLTYAFEGKDRNSFLGNTVNNDDKRFFGYEFSLPMTWHTDGNGGGRSELQLQPYLIKENIDRTSTIFGARLVLGYNF